MKTDIQTDSAKAVASSAVTTTNNVKQARLAALKTLDMAESRREKVRQYESRCSCCHGEPHTLGECPIGDGFCSEAKEIQRLNGIIRRASVRFFEDGTSDGETAAAMLKILDEAKQPAAIASRDMVVIGGDDYLV